MTRDQTPAIQSMIPVDDPEARIMLIVEHEQGYHQAAPILDRWVRNMTNFADGRDLLQEILEWQETGRVNPPPTLPARIRAYLQSTET